MNSLIIDNHDSFTYNLYHLLGAVTGREPVVIANDDVHWRREHLRSFDMVVISPGPGNPEVPSDMGISRDVLVEREILRPLLGVCLGHQGLCHELGGRVERAPEPVHGRVDTILHRGHPLFQGIPETFDVVRYHSLIASRLPPELSGIAWTLDGLLMAVSHRELPLWGVQFHPESACCQFGRELLLNFCRLADMHRTGQRTLVGAAGTAPREVPAPPAEAVPPVETLRLRARRLSPRVDTETAFVALHGSSSDPALWLDSNDPGSSMSRVSVIADASGPNGRYVQAQVAQGQVRWRSAGAGDWSERDVRFFDWMDEDLRGCRLEEDAVPVLPFDVRPGWFGHLGYELKAETGGQAAAQPELPAAWMMFADRILVHDHARGDWWALAACPASRAAADAEFARWSAAIESLLESASHAQAPALPTLPEGRNLVLRHGADDYVHLVRECQKEILCGESYELCLTNALQFELVADADALQIYRHLRRRNPTSFSCFLRGPDWSVLSLSPERFVRVDRHRTIQSRPMKGTRPRGADEAADVALRQELASSPKDRAENLMILDLVRNDVGRCSRLAGVDPVSMFEVETYATVHQMTSTVEGRMLDGASSVDAVRHAFPPGSMTGAPKVRSMAILDQLEGGPRGIYSGSLGYFALNGTADFNVVIRSLVKVGRRMHLGCGGAVIALSEPQAELDEIIVKSRALLSAFGLSFPRTGGHGGHRPVLRAEVPLAWRPVPAADEAIEASLARLSASAAASSRLLLPGGLNDQEPSHRVLGVFGGVLLHVQGRGLGTQADQPASLVFEGTADGSSLMLQGRLLQVDDLEADAVFSGLPRAEQIRAWLAEEEQLTVDRAVDRYAGQAIARPRAFRVCRLSVWRTEHQAGSVPGVAGRSGAGVVPKDGTSAGASLAEA
ncbi:chorismate-binding protein [Rubrivivax sp. RP6-9]|uniref:chorismate-binding protein n=1 Tax=Rubrivivax sp. RP6-9 TaxID=3415750 RepID=UPI003CC552FD